MPSFRGEYKVFYLYRMPPEPAGPEDAERLGEEYFNYGYEY
jgi:hypothetical protein